MTDAIVYVFPDPVTPSRTCRARPLASPPESSRIAPGWSPAGANGAASWNLGLKSLLVLPGSSPLAVLEEDARHLELLADAVGLGEILACACYLPRLDPLQDPVFRDPSRNELIL